MEPNLRWRLARLFVLGMTVGFGSSAHAEDGDTEGGEKDRVVHALVEATEAGNLHRIEQLLRSEDCDVNARGPDGMTALHWAVYHEHASLAERLLQRGADASLSNRYGVTPLATACIAGHSQMVAALLKSGADAKAVVAGKTTMLMLAARTGRLAPVQLLLDAGADANVQDVNDQTAIMWAAAEGHANVVETLIKHGADWQATLDSGFNAFTFAVREGRMDVVRVLLKSGAKVNDMMNPERTGGRAARRGMTALLLAIENGHFELAKLLLESGADANDQRSGFTPLHTLAWVRKPHSGDNIDGAPAPIGSGKLTSLDLVHELVAHGADVNARLKKGKGGRGEMNHKAATPFLFAARRNDVPYMSALLELGADPTIPNADNCTPLLAAAGIGTRAPREEAGTEEEALESVKLLLSLGADINHVDDNGETAMHGAAYKSLPRMVKFLGENGCDIDVWNRKNKYGWTPTLIAEGHRVGNFKPAAETLEAVYEQLRAAGVEPPPKTPREKKFGYGL